MSLSRVVIDSLRDSDIPALYQWANDLSELGYWTMRRRQWLREDYEAHIKQMAREFGIFIVRSDRADEPVALIEVTTRELDGVAEMLLYVAPEHRRGRAWLNGMMQVIQHAFASLPLHKILFRIFEFNRRTLHIMRAARLKEEGRFKEVVWHGTRYWDMFVFGFSRPEWDSGEGVARLKRAVRFTP